MSEKNPYQTPQEPSSKGPPDSKHFVWCASAVFGCAVVGSILGMALGGLIGAIAPGYYRSVFSTGGGADFNPIGFGIALGLGQGAVFGGIVGLVLIVILYWFRSRSE